MIKDLLTADDVREFIALRIQKLEMTQADYAAYISYDRRSLNNVLTGRIAPSKTLLSKLGFKKVILYEEE